MITVYPEKIAAFGARDAENFCLVTNSRYIDSFEISSDNNYCARKIIAYDASEPFKNLIVRGSIPPLAHVLVISPEHLIHSIEESLLDEIKLLIMACKSGPTALAAIQFFLEIGYATSITFQQQFVDRFFSSLESSEMLRIEDREHGLPCSFDHISEKYEWHEQCGALQWGDQQVFPSGEIACFSVPLYSEELLVERTCQLSGEMVLRGPVIVQSGTPSFRKDDQCRIHDALTIPADSGLHITINDGIVVAHRALDARAVAAERMFSSLFHVDSRYRTVYELGFSFNDFETPWDGNTAMNEVWGPAGGRMHIGLGMLPFTQYHIDMFLMGSTLFANDGSYIFGARTLRRSKTGQCPCVQV